jgi:glycosyltransferase involved in cell wall biosynthesis
MIRVLLDGRVSGRDGIGRYTACLAPALRAAGGTSIHLTVLEPTGTPRYSLAEGTELARAAADASADVIHSLDFRMPADPVPVPVVATVHDVLRLDHHHCYANDHFGRRFGDDGLALLRDAVRHLRDLPGSPGPGALPAGASLHAEFYARMLAWTCLQARHVVTPTVTVAAQLARQVPLTAGPVPVPLGVDHMTAATAGGTARPLGIAPGYLLYVGQARMHKGLHELIAAYQRSRASAIKVPLVCAGRDFEPGTDATATVKDALGRDAITVGEVPDSVLRDLYGQAAALIHLATHEGFGLTPLEAMACGTPVIASDIPVLRETLGQHAELADPGSAQDAAKAIDKVLTGPGDRHARDARVRWAGRYTWLRHAETIIGLYKGCQPG